MAFPLTAGAITSASTPFHLPKFSRADVLTLKPMLILRFRTPNVRKFYSLLIASTLFSRPVFTDPVHRRTTVQIARGVSAFCKVSPLLPSTHSFCVWRANFPEYSTLSSFSIQSGGSSNMDPPKNGRLAVAAETIADNLERPEVDNREYRVIRLANKLEALIIHDPDTDKASAALDVNAGSFSDSEDMPGLAHAVEHALFMGTEKYPGENDYSSYLTKHSGHSNAYTASTSTNYYFEVDARPTVNKTGLVDSWVDREASPLFGALDRFAQFFIAPIFDKETLDRELRAVDSENKKNLQSDTWRLYQLSKSLSNPEHPFHHFSTGNLQTLRDGPQGRGVNVRDEFMKFHEVHYSANRMKLVVLGREPLDQLQQWVEELFADVKNKNLPQNRWDAVEPLTNKEILTQITAKPVMETRSLDLCFRYQCEDDMFETQPSRYLGHLLGHEGPGSIFAYIKSKGWANSLNAGSMELCPGAALFTVSIRLTPDGLANYKDVAKTVFQYLSMLRETPPQKWIFDEMKQMAEVNFRFKQKSPASSTTSSLSSTMQDPLPRDWLLSGKSLIRKFDSDAISQALSYLRPDNFRLQLVTPDPLNGTVHKEEWYSTEYTYEKLPDDFLREIRKAADSTASERPAELHLPAKNEFIPSKFEVNKKEVSEPLKHPKLIRNDDNVRAWYKKDDQFWVPKANIYVTLRSPLLLASAQLGLMGEFYRELVEDALSEYSYDASLSGLDYDISCHSSGVDIIISGYNDKMPVLLEKVLSTMRHLEVKNDRFDIVKERLARAYRNYQLSTPYHQIGRYTTWLNHEKLFMVEECLAEFSNIQAEDIRSFYPQLLKQAHIEVLAHGNLHREDALRAASLVEEIIQPRTLPSSQWPTLRNLLLPEGSNYVYDHILPDPANVNHCIEYFCFVGEVTDRKQYAQLLLMGQMTEEPAFNQLRTKEQLGYVVFSGASVHGTTAGYRVLIQSEKSPEYLEGRIDSFLGDYRKRLADMSQNDFESHKRSIVNKRLEKLKNLGQESSRFWRHIGSEYYRFDAAENEAEEIRKLTKEDMIFFFDRFINPASSTRSKLSVHMVARFFSEAAKIAPEEQSTGIIKLLEQYLGSHGLEAKQDILKSRFQNIDPVSGNTPSLINALKAYLTEDLKISSDKVNSLTDQATSLIGSAIPSLNDQSQSDIKGDAGANTSNANKAEKIENVYNFKASMRTAPGPTPVKDLGEFEDRPTKL